MVYSCERNGQLAREVLQEERKGREGRGKEVSNEVREGREEVRR